MNAWADDDFRLIFKPLAEGVHFTFVSDSCHSGGLLDTVEVQIGLDDDGEVGDHTVDAGAQGKDFSYEDAYTTESSNDKSLSIETLTQMLSERTGHEVLPGQIRTTLYDMFSGVASQPIQHCLTCLFNLLYLR